MLRSMNTFALIAFASAVLGPLASGNSVTADRTIWQGKYSETERANFAHVAGDDWIEVVRSGGQSDRIPYREVTRTAAFIELQMTGRPEYRIRLYSDRLEKKSTNGSDRWVELATGRWTE